jgi:RNA polymerase sigma-70 factor, ECF subfamily
MTVATDYQVSTTARALRLVEPATARRALPCDAPRATADNSALSELWRQHGAVITRFALKLTLGNMERANEIAQETMLRAWRHPEVVGSGDLPIRPWLFTVTWHVAIDIWRARSRTDDLIDDDQACWLPQFPDPAEPIEQALAIMDVRAALAKLTPEHRQVRRRNRRGHDIPEGTVKSRAYYGLRYLRRLMSDPSAQIPQSASARPPSRREPRVVVAAPRGHAGHHRQHGDSSSQGGGRPRWHQVTASHRSSQPTSAQAGPRQPRTGRTRAGRQAGALCAPGAGPAEGWRRPRRSFIVVNCS